MLEQTISLKRAHAQADQIVEAIAHLLEMHAHQIEEDVDDETLTIEHVISRIEEYRKQNAKPELLWMDIGQKNRWIGWMQAVCVLHKYASLSEFAEINYGAWTDNKPKTDQHPVQPDAAAAP